MELSQIKPFLIYQFKSDSELVQTIEQISKNFTSERENISQYLEDPKMVAAYAAFYMTTNMPKLDAVIEKLGDFNKLIEDRDIIDIGCGPGTFLLALRQRYPQNANQFIGVESSPLMRKQALRIADGLGLKVQITGDIKNIRSKNPLVIFGHSVNEMGAKTALSYIKKIDPYCLLFLEPGTKQAFAPMMEIRSILLQSDYDIHFPCPSNAECPMAKDTSDWCHQYLYIQQDINVQRLGQMAKKNRNLLPMIIHAYAKNEFRTRPTNASLADSQYQTGRVVRYLRQTKHSFEWQLCMAENGNIPENDSNHLMTVELPKRGLSKKDVKQLEQIYAGDLLNYQVVRTIEEGKVRIDLT